MDAELVPGINEQNKYNIQITQRRKIRKTVLKYIFEYTDGKDQQIPDKLREVHEQRVYFIRVIKPQK